MKVTDVDTLQDPLCGELGAEADRIKQQMRGWSEGQVVAVQAQFLSGKRKKALKDDCLQKHVNALHIADFYT